MVAFPPSDMTHCVTVLKGLDRTPESQGGPHQSRGQGVSPLVTVTAGGGWSGIQGVAWGFS